jgi:AcrR family transcriptional regulator
MSNDTTDPKLQGGSPFNRTVQHDAKRAAILSQAARLFNSKGSRATTLLDIAQNLGLTKTSLYYYVKTKEELIYQCYLATLARWHEILDELDTRPLQPLDLLQQFFRQNFSDWLAAHDGTGAHLAQLLEIASLKEQHRSDVEKRYTAMFKRLRQYLRDGIANGTVRPCETNATTLAMLGSVQWSFNWLHAIPREEVARSAEDAWDILLLGLFNGPCDFTFDRTGFNPDPPVTPGGFDREEQNRLKQEAFYKTGTRFFNKKGFNGTSLDEIAEQLNVTKGAFYYHIKNKEDLLFACYSRSLDIMAQIHAEAAGQGGSGLQQIESTCRQVFRVQNSSQGPLIRYNSITALPIDRRRQILDRTDRYNDYFGEVIQKGIDDGSIRPVKPFVAENLIAGALNASMDIEMWRPVEDLEQASIDYFDVFFNGLQPRSRSAQQAGETR